MSSQAGGGERVAGATGTAGIATRSIRDTRAASSGEARRQATGSRRVRAGRATVGTVDATLRRARKARLRGAAAGTGRAWRRVAGRPARVEGCSAAGRVPPGLGAGQPDDGGLGGPASLASGGSRARRGAAGRRGAGRGLEIRDDVSDQVVQLLGERHPRVAQLSIPLLHPRRAGGGSSRLAPIVGLAGRRLVQRGATNRLRVRAGGGHGTAAGAVSRCRRPWP